MMQITEREKPIGVFDSGVGGLTVVGEIIRNIPKERIVYFGDTARVPYGNKSRDTVLRYSRQIAHFLLKQDVKAIVIACNTASAFALEELQKELTIPVIGVIEAGAQVACASTKNNRIGVIGTKGTVSSGIHAKLIHEYNPQMQVYGKACPLFVPFVEENWVEDAVIESVAEHYLSELKCSEVDTLILGCTHYPLLKKTIGKIMGPGVTMVDPAYETACQLRNRLQQLQLTNDRSIGRDEFPHRFFVSDHTDAFRDFAEQILSCKECRAEVIPMEQ